MDTGIAAGRIRKPFYFSAYWVASLYLLAITAAELVTTHIDPAAGLVAHSVLLVILLVQIAFFWDQPIHKLLLTLTFAPLIRLLSLSMPLINFPIITWYLIVSIPMFAAAFVVARILGMSFKDMGFSFQKPRIQILVVLGGFALGYVEYLILKPEPLILELSLSAFLIPSIILIVGTGLIEELLFRGMMQKVGLPLFGRASIFFSTAVFTALHIGYRSLIDLVFVFGAGFFWGYIVYKTKSILGVTISHGIANIMLFLVLPFLFSKDGSLITSGLTTEVPMFERVLYAIFYGFQEICSFIWPVLFLAYGILIFLAFKSTTPKKKADGEMEQT